MSLSRIIGHAQLVSLLREAAVRKRVPQSLLFAGPEGVGKKTVALALAKAVTCHTPVEGDVLFPPFDRSQWRRVSTVPHAPDDRHPFAFTFRRYERA